MSRLDFRSPVSEQVFPLLEQQAHILRHLLFWLQDQHFYRARWHSAVSRLALLDVCITEDIDLLIAEVEQLRQQFPYGYPPLRDTEACTLCGRLSLLRCELEVLRSMCEQREATLLG